MWPARTQVDKLQSPLAPYDSLLLAGVLFQVLCYHYPGTSDFFGITSQSPQPATSGLFDRVPPKIAQQIASWLPFSSAAALTLCDHKMDHVLCDQYLLALRQVESNRSERVLFMQALNRDISDGFLLLLLQQLHLLVQKQEDELVTKERSKRVSESRYSGAMALTIMTPHTTIMHS